MHVAMQLQSEAFLVPDQHEESKYQGKVRTNHDRMVFSFHYVRAIARYLSHAGASNIQPGSADFVTNFCVPAQVDEKTVRFAYWFAEHCDLVWSSLDMSGSAYQAAPRARMQGEGSE